VVQVKTCANVSNGSIVSVEIASRGVAPQGFDPGPHLKVKLPGPYRSCESVSDPIAAGTALLRRAASNSHALSARPRIGAELCATFYMVSVIAA
jgi:hypothetical protein